ncbi:MAG: hypothetical protein U1E65_11625 [Myxococcota bacterium]
MSAISVRNEIRNQMKHSGCSNPLITEGGMAKIGKDALADKTISPSEARQIDTLVKNGHQVVGQFMTMACPEHPGNYYNIEKGAVTAANALFAENGLPYGENRAAIRAKIQGAIDEGYPAKLDKAPRLTGLHQLEISNKLMIDGPKVDAFLNAKTGDFYLRVTGSGFGGPEHIGPFYYGPGSIDLKTPLLKKSTINKALVALNKALAKGKINFEASSPPLGEHMVRVQLMKEKHPDGFTYTALFPAGALAPGAPASDPNKDKSIWIERSGGLAGLTEYAPLNLK